MPDPSSGLEVRRLAGAIGAEVRGVDLRARLDGAARERVVAALYDHHVIFFPGQRVALTDLAVLAGQFGEVERPVNPGAPVGDVQVRAFDSADGGKIPAWHTDVTWMEQPPGIQVFVVDTLPEAGGDTMWASTAAAYDDLDTEWQRFLEPLTAVHDETRMSEAFVDPRVRSGYGGPAGAPRGPTRHPVVHVHPVTGRRALYVNPVYTTRIVELSPAESEVVLRVLFAQVTRPEFVVRYRWAVGTVAVWDNLATWHYAVDDYGDARRVVQRVSVRGHRPVGVPAAAGA